MDALLIALKLVTPMCVFMVIGYCLQKRNFFSREALADINKLVFKILLPLNVVKSIYSSDIHEGGDVRVLIFVAITTTLLNVICALIVPRIESDRRRIPVMIQGIAKSNYVLVGLSMVMQLYGDDIGMAGVLVALTAPLNNTLSTIIFESYRGENVRYSQFIKKILLNPFVFSGLLGLALKFFAVPVPKIIMTDVIGKIGSCATPIALIMMGAGFSFESAGHYKKQISIVTISRLIVVPLAEIPIMILLGFKGADLLAMTICAAAPTAVNSYTTAVSMGGDGDLAGALVAVTSVCSIVTIFMWVSLLSGLGLL